MTLWAWLEGGGPADALAGTGIGPVSVLPLAVGRARIRVELDGVTHQADVLGPVAGAASLAVDPALPARVRQWAADRTPAPVAPTDGRSVWSDVPVRFLDALVPTFGEGSLAAWLDAWRPEPIAVDVCGVAATWRPVRPRVSRAWGDLGVTVLQAEVAWCGAESGDGGTVVTAGPMRMGSLGAAGWACPAPEAAPRLADQWRAIVRARLVDVATRAGGEAMVPPWLVAPNAPLASILAEYALQGAPAIAVPDVSSTVARAVACVARLPDAAGLPRWGIGAYTIEVDPGAGRVTIVHEGVRAVVLDTHPWEPGVRGGLDGDAPATVALLRWLGQVIAASGTDARARWVARDPEGPGGLDDGDHELSVAAFLMLEDPLEPILDARVQGLPVGTTPSHAWSELSHASALEAAQAARDRFRAEWVDA